MHTITVFSTDGGVCFVGDTDKKKFGHVMEGEGHQPDSDSETSYDQVHTGGCLFVVSCPTQEYFPSIENITKVMCSKMQALQPLSREGSYSATSAVTHVCLS